MHTTAMSLGKLWPEMMVFARVFRSPTLACTINALVQEWSRRFGAGQKDRRLDCLEAVLFCGCASTARWCTVSVNCCSRMASLSQAVAWRLGHRDAAVPGPWLSSPWVHDILGCT